MSDDAHNPKYATIADLLADADAVEDALNRASEQAILRHQRLGQEVVLWQDGKPVVLSGKELDAAVAESRAAKDEPSSSAA